MTAEEQQAALRLVLLAAEPDDVIVCWRTSPDLTCEGAPSPTFRIEVLKAAGHTDVVGRLPSHAWAYMRSGRECVAIRGRVGRG